MQTVIRQSSSYLIVAFLTLDYTRSTEQLLILIGVLFAPLYNFLRGIALGKYEASAGSAEPLTSQPNERTKRGPPMRFV